MTEIGTSEDWRQPLLLTGKELVTLHKIRREREKYVKRGERVHAAEEILEFV